MRLQKYLAQAGFGARRKCEQLIIDGRVTVNGRIATLGQSCAPNDDVRVDNKRIDAAEDKIYIALHKPVDYASDLGEPHSKTMFDLIDSAVVPQRLFGVGRLDKDSSGLILLTNDGEFAYRLTHPKFEHEKEYRVLVQGVPSEATLQRWRDGILLEPEAVQTAACEVDVMRPAPTPALPRLTGEGVWLRIVMHEGRKRQIRRVAKLLGHPVIELMRVRVGSVRLGTLQSGRWRKLTDREVKSLLALSASEPQLAPHPQIHDRPFRAHARAPDPNHRD